MAPSLDLDIANGREKHVNISVSVDDKQQTWISFYKFASTATDCRQVVLTIDQFLWLVDWLYTNRKAFGNVS